MSDSPLKIGLASHSKGPNNDSSKRVMSVLHLANRRGLSSKIQVPAQGSTTVCPEEMSSLNIILHPVDSFSFSMWSPTASRSPIISNHNSLLRWRPDDLVHIARPPWKRSGYFLVGHIAQLRKKLLPTRPHTPEWRPSSAILE